jgi:hypothetical protein
MTAVLRRAFLSEFFLGELTGIALAALAILVVRLLTA